MIKKSKIRKKNKQDNFVEVGCGDAKRNRSGRMHVLVCVFSPRSHHVRMSWSTVPQLNVLSTLHPPPLQTLRGGRGCFGRSSCRSTCTPAPVWPAGWARWHRQSHGDYCQGRPLRMRTPCRRCIVHQSMNKVPKAEAILYLQLLPPPCEHVNARCHARCR